LAKNKLRKFAQMKDYPHVEEPEMELLKQGYALKGNWKKEFFKNDNPLVLELGCGMGEYSVGLAEKFPDKNFLGIDIKGARMWQGAIESLEKGMKNVGFLRIRIDWIEKCFELKT
jgi:tRNA (guanine-N7-)-methyltransferase